MSMQKNAVFLIEYLMCEDFSKFGTSVFTPPTCVTHSSIVLAYLHFLEWPMVASLDHTHTMLPLQKYLHIVVTLGSFPFERDC